MSKKQRTVIFWGCVTFSMYRVILLILDCLDLKYIITNHTCLEDGMRQLLSIGKVQYDIVILVISFFCPYMFNHYLMKSERKKRDNPSKLLPSNRENVCVGMLVLTHMLSFGFFQYYMWILYTNNPTSLLEIVNWVWKPLLFLIMDYLIVHLLLFRWGKKYKQWHLINILLVFFLSIIVMDMLTSGFMWSSNWRLLYIANFLCEVLLVAERMIV